METMKLKNKIAVITGPTSGIGHAIAKEFKSQGAGIVLFGRSEDKLKEIQTELGNDVIYVSGDVTKVTDIERLYKITAEKFGKIDILVANAGYGILKPSPEVTEKDFDDLMAVNYRGVYFTVQRAFSYLNKNASVILMASVAGHIGAPNLAAYGSTKAAVLSMARCFAAELINEGIRVNSISPGFTHTPFLGKVNLREEHFERLAQKIPMSRFAQAEEIAKAALYLASDDSAYITGTDILIDGGRVNLFL